jgi:hypothetical protein
MCLTAKREVDDANYDPEFLASLRHKRHLGYGPERYPFRVFMWRRRNGIPQELVRMAKINSSRKGKVGELEAAAEWNRLVANAHARRSQQYSGTDSSSDLVSPGTPHLWLEVKRVQSLNLTAVMQKSREQCGELCPVVLHRKNDQEWLVTFPLEDIKRFVQQVSGAM